MLPRRIISMLDRRVVITGVSVVSALGIGKEEYISALFKNISGIERIKAFDPTGFPSQVAGESPHIKMSKVVPKSHRKATKLMSRDIELAVTAADSAVRDAQLNTRGINPEEPIDIEPTRCGVNIGAGLICCNLEELAAAVETATDNNHFSLRKWGSEGMNRLTPLWLLKYLPNMLSCHISIIHDLQGCSNSITCAEASGLLAIGEAFRSIARGHTDLMVAGGAESKVTPMGLLRQCLLNRASTSYNDQPHQACRPFDRGADGSVIGEGSGIVILEELEHARRRGVDIYAELKGFGASNNFSDDFVQPEEQAAGTVQAMKKALRQAQLSPDQIHLLVPHGVAVPGHDRAEAGAIKTIFGEYSRELPVFATNSRIGNCGAASAAIDFATSVLMMKENKVPANLNCPDLPEEYGLNLTKSPAIETEIKHAMTCSYTYGGQTAALIAGKIED